MVGLGEGNSLSDKQLAASQSLCSMFHVFYRAFAKRSTKKWAYWIRHFCLSAPGPHVTTAEHWVQYEGALPTRMHTMVSYLKSDQNTTQFTRRPRCIHVHITKYLAARKMFLKKTVEKTRHVPCSLAFFRQLFCAFMYKKAGTVTLIQSFHLFFFLLCIIHYNHFAPRLFRNNFLQNRSKCLLVWHPRSCIH
jgi:hypothetical protein